MNPNRTDPEYKSYIRLVTANQRRIYGFIYAIVPNRTASDDIMQETSILMWEHFDQFKEGTNFAAWGISIARNIVMQYCRKQKQSHLTFDIKAMENLVSQSDIYDSNEAAIEALRRCFKKLRNSDQKLLEMRYFQCESVQKIAESVNRTTSHLYRVMAAIHKLLLKCINTQLTSQGI
jgi:RNA polymerase sigma-70 factor (ECF subfamily)